MSLQRAGRSPRVHGIVVTFNRPTDLVTSCHVALSQTWRPHTLVVVDNSDQPFAEEALRSVLDLDDTELRVIHPGENVGPAGGCHLGMEALDAQLEDDDLILVLDDDDPLRGPDVVRDLVRLSEELAATDSHFGGVGLQGARFDTRWLRTRPVEASPAQVQRVDHLHGGYAPLYRVDALTGAGGFRPDLFWGFEELETGLRVTASGRHLYMACALLRSLDALPKDLRDGQPRLILREASPRRYYALRNLLWIGRQYSGWANFIWVALVRGLLKPLVSVPFAPRASLAQLGWNARAVRDAARGRLGRTLTW